MSIRDASESMAIWSARRVPPLPRILASLVVCALLAWAWYLLAIAVSVTRAYAATGIGLGTDSLVPASALFPGGRSEAIAALFRAPLSPFDFRVLAILVSSWSTVVLWAPERRGWTAMGVCIAVPCALLGAIGVSMGSEDVAALMTFGELNPEVLDEGWYTTLPFPWFACAMAFAWSWRARGSEPSHSR